MSDNPRIDELRRRVERDPTSIAFAQLAEEYRRGGEHEQAVKVCRDGLARHPGYLSAQVTLGRALMELGQLDEARTELEAVLHVAPDNLAAIRALAEIHQRLGDAGEPIATQPPVAAARPAVAPERQAATREPEAEPESQPEPEPVEEPAEPELEPLAAITLDMPPLEDALPVDLSLDATMPTFDEMMDMSVPDTSVVDTSAPSPFSFDAPEETPAPTEEDLPSFDALDSLTLDLPPMPDFSNWTLDTDLALDLPEPIFSDPHLDDLEATTPRVEGADPVLGELEDWLSAIVADRSRTR